MQTFALGLAIGLAAGASPGPLLVLVISQTLRSGWRAGLLTAAAPLLTDLLIASSTVLVLQHLPRRTLPVLGVIGGLYVIWSGIETWRDAGLPTAEPGADGPPPGAALRRAATVNLLSPHPWVAWATVLGPLTVSAWRHSPWTGGALVIGFYLTLVGTKAVLATVVAGGRGRLSEPGLRGALRAAAAVLVLAGVALAAEFVPQAISA